MPVQTRRTLEREGYMGSGCPVREKDGQCEKRAGCWGLDAGEMFAEVSPPSMSTLRWTYVSTEMCVPILAGADTE